MGATGGGSVAGSFSGGEVALLVVVILAVVALVVAVAFFAIARPLRRLKAERMAEARAMLGAEGIVFLDPGAAFFGQSSLGMSQVRGNGCLAVSRDTVLFLMWVPEREFRVAVAAIRRIETSKSHLGKSKFRPLLKLTFAGRDGGEDSMAWWVRDLAQAKAALKESTRGGG